MSQKTITQDLVERAARVIDRVENGKPVDGAEWNYLKLDFDVYVIEGEQIADFKEAHRAEADFYKNEFYGVGDSMDEAEFIELTDALIEQHSHAAAELASSKRGRVTTASNTAGLNISSWVQDYTTELHNHIYAGLHNS